MNRSDWFGVAMILGLIGTAEAVVLACSHEAPQLIAPVPTCHKTTLRGVQRIPCPPGWENPFTGGAPSK
jgi:hypothetical protein